MIRTTLCLAIVSCALLGYAQDAAPAPAAEPAAAPAPEPVPAVPLDQVQIQVWISETNEAGLREIGANLDYTRFDKNGQERNGSLQEVNVETFDNNADFEPAVVPGPNTLPVPGNNMFGAALNNPGVPRPFGAGNGAMRPDMDGGFQHLQYPGGAGLQASIIDSDFGTIDLSMRAIERNEDSDLISKPELLVLNNGVAQIHAGTLRPYQDLKYEKAAPTLSVNWRDVGVNLSLQPLILNNDFVQITVQELNVTERRDATISGRFVDLFSQRSQTGVVNVPNGRTLVVGGLTSSTVSHNERRVPLLGALPLIGMPFRSREATSKSTTLLIFVSPTIVNLRDMTDEAFSALNFWQESRWQNSSKIQDEITTLEENTL